MNYFKNDPGKYPISVINISEYERVSNIGSALPIVSTARNTKYDYYVDRFFHQVKDVFYILKDANVIKSKSELDEMDYIDLFRAVNEDYLKNKITPQDIPKFSMLKNWNDANQYLIDNHNNPDIIYSFLPPLDRGILRVNRNCYIFYDNVMFLNKENALGTDGYVQADIEVYRYDPKYGLYLDVYGNAGCIFNLSPDDEITYQTGMAQYNDTLKLLTDNKDTIMSRLSHDDQLFFENVVLKELQDGEDKNFNEDNGRVIAANFFLFVLYTNFMLSTNRTQKKRESCSGNSVKIIAGDIDPKKKQIIRAVGKTGIKVKSVKVPRAQSKKEVVRKYSLPSWTSRGHLRHYKNGNVVYVRPSVHHRKCLIGKENSDIIPQVVIKV